MQREVPEPPRSGGSMKQKKTTTYINDTTCTKYTAVFLLMKAYLNSCSNLAMIITEVTQSKHASNWKILCYLQVIVHMHGIVFLEYHLVMIDSQLLLCKNIQKFGSYDPYLVTVGIQRYLYTLFCGVTTD